MHADSIVLDGPTKVPLRVLVRINLKKETEQEQKKSSIITVTIMVTSTI